MIITCPSCGTRYQLERRPPATFHCRKCSFSAPFQVVLDQGKEKPKPAVKHKVSILADADAQATPDTRVGGETKIVNELQGDHTHVVPGLGDGFAAGSKTKVVQSLQPPRKAALLVYFNGRPFRQVLLPGGSYNLGRLSSDSTAQVKLAPDMAMSRVHAAMRITKVNGQFVYQITSIKDENPVYVNNLPIAKGKACSLRNGDQIRMGATMMLFRFL